eukprot:3844477-Alexandrium_andersonii.AAC.1
MPRKESGTTAALNHQTQAAATFGATRETISGMLGHCSATTRGWTALNKSPTGVRQPARGLAA